MKKRVFIIGLDGASWRVLQPIMKENLMPNLSILIERGSSGILESTLPPITAPAWTTFQTGVNPGKHGLFDFLGYRPESYQFPLHSSKSIKLKTIWEIVSEVQKTVVSINVPMTYPPKVVNGALVAGMMSPSVQANFTYPPDLYKELKDHIGEYTIFPSPELFFSDDEEKIVYSFIDIEKRRKDAALYLMQRFDWDLFMIHNQCLDILQHRFWPYIFKEHPRFDEKKWRPISPFFQAMDSHIGELLSKLDKQTTVIIISDHGFCNLDHTVNLNKWLELNGFLSFKKERLPSQLFSSLKKLDVFQIRKKLSFITKEKVKAKLYQGWLLDWSKTKAFSGQGGGLIHINRKGREGLGIVTEGKEYEEIRKKIIEGLMDFKNPEDGKNIIKRVFRKEEIFHGPFIDHAPDLIVQPASGYAFKKALSGKKILSETVIGRDSVGTHDQDGIFIFSGNSIKKESPMREAHLADIAPTVLHLLDINRPRYMDGKELRNIFKE